MKKENFLYTYHTEKVRRFGLTKLEIHSTALIKIQLLLHMYTVGVFLKLGSILLWLFGLYRFTFILNPISWSINNTPRNYRSVAFSKYNKNDMSGFVLHFCCYR